MQTKIFLIVQTLTKENKMTVVQKNLGLTINGNEYKKSNTGKVAGATTGFVLPAAAMAIQISQVKDSIDLQNTNAAFKNAANCAKGCKAPLDDLFKQSGKKLLTKQNLKTLGIAGCALAATTIVGMALGNLYDKCVNKERMTQADGEAARAQCLSQNV